MKKTRQSLVMILFVLIVGIGVAGVAPKVDATEPTELQLLVDQARITFQSMISEYRMAWLRDNLYQAKGVLIIPRLFKGGFIFGGSGGWGVLLVKDPDTGQWSQPAFYSLGGGSIGFQIGIESAEVIMMVRTQKAVDRLLSSSFKLGGDMSLTAGPVGQGVKSNVTADIYSFSRTQGLFGGVALDGAYLKTSDDRNAAYYGRPVSPADILISNLVNNPGSLELRNAVANAARINK
jgi:lipid-binding SYLF domain-containing protein